jgi:hypothetical protein
MLRPGPKCLTGNGLDDLMRLMARTNPSTGPIDTLDIFVLPGLDGFGSALLPVEVNIELE